MQGRTNKFTHENFQKDKDVHYRNQGFTKVNHVFFYGSPFQEGDSGCLFYLKKTGSEDTFKEGYKYPSYVYFEQTQSILFSCNEKVETVYIADKEKFQIHLRYFLDDANDRYDYRLLNFEIIHVMITLDGGHVPIKDPEFENELDKEQIEFVKQELEEAEQEKKAKEEKRAERAKQTEQTKQAEKIKQTEQAKQVEQAKQTEKTKQVEQAKQTEKTKHTEQVKQTEIASTVSHNKKPSRKLRLLNDLFPCVYKSKKENKNEHEYEPNVDEKKSRRVIF